MSARRSTPRSARRTASTATPPAGTPTSDSTSRTRASRTGGGGQRWAPPTKNTRRLTAGGLGMGGGAPAPDKYVVCHPSQNAPDQLNHLSDATPEVDALLEAGRSSCAQSDR